METNFTTAELQELALPFDLNGESASFRSFVREMLDEWDAENLVTHVRAMERRALVHDDPGCLDTAHIAATLLASRHGIAISIVEAA